MKKDWSVSEMNILLSAHEGRAGYETDYQLAGRIAPKLKRSTESVRWQLRQLHRNVIEVQPPKILILDIETLPIEALVWDVWKQNIYLDQIKKDWSVLCYGAKWLFDTKVMGRSVTAEEAVKHEDASILPEIWELMNEADYIVWHNGENFDAKKLNSRFFVHNMPKPMYYKSVDTLNIAKDNFSLTYNKLDWIAQIIGIGRKIETEFKWWKECDAGNQKYLDMMLKYNKHDVNLEEEVYLRLRPWMTGHPNMNLYANMQGNLCPACSSNNIVWKGKYATSLGLYQAFRCQDCGAIGRSSKKQYKLGASQVQN